MRHPIDSLRRPRSFRPSHPTAAREPRGFTLADLLAVIALTALVSTAVVAGPIFGSRENAFRVKCSSNLRQIALGSLLYANSEVRTGAFPRTRFDVAAGKVTAYTKWDAPDPFKEGGPEVNDVTAALYLVQRTQDITPNVFVCPSSTAKRWDFGPKKKADAVSNFPDGSVLAYSYATPYPTKEAIAAGFKFNSALGSDVPLASDMNPGGEALTKLKMTSSKEELKAGQSPNHGQEGQNVVYCDGHVEWQNTPFCGSPVGAKGQGGKDNIFTYGESGNDKGGAGVVGQPTAPTDFVLLPTPDMGKAAATKPATP